MTTALAAERAALRLVNAQGELALPASLEPARRLDRPERGACETTRPEELTLDA